MDIIINSFKNWKKKEYLLWISAMLMLIVISAVKNDDNWVLTLLASLASITAGVLLYKGKQLGFALYILYSVLYTIIALTSRMYGEAILYGIYALPMYVVSTVRWLKNGEHEEFMEIQKIDRKHTFIILALAVAITIIYGYILGIMNSAVPYLNSLGTVCSATAIYMTNKKYKEQWWAWLSYSLVFAAIWMSNMTITFAMQSAVFVVLNICGLLSWQKKYHEQNQ